MLAYSSCLLGLVWINFPGFSISCNFFSTPLGWERTWADKQVEHINKSVFRKKYRQTILMLHSQSLKLGKANFVILTFNIVFTYNITYLFFSPAVGYESKVSVVCQTLLPIAAETGKWTVNDTGDCMKKQDCFTIKTAECSPGGWKSVLLLLENSSRRVLIVLVFNFIPIILGADLTT